MELTAYTTPPTSAAEPQKARNVMRLGIGLSVGAHGVLGLLFLMGDFNFNPTVDLNKNVIQTRLVKLGKERKKEWLPRKSKPPPPKQKAKKTQKPAAAIKPPQPQKKPLPKAKPASPTPTKPKEPPPPANRDAQMSNALSKLQAAQATDLNQLISDKMKVEEDEGSAQGSVLGTEVSGEMKASYNALLGAHIQNNFELPTVLTEQERMMLRAHVTIRIGNSGDLLFVKIIKSSGNAAFDNSVVKAAKNSVPLPNPPLVLRSLYQKGVTLEFCPIRCE